MISDMDIFYFLRKVRELERRRLPFIKSLEDRDIVLAIGQSQVRGDPLALKQLLLSGIAPTATLHRRLTRLVEAGVVTKTFRNGDRRMIELTLTLPVLKTFEGYARVLATVAKRSTKGKGLPSSGPSVEGGREAFRYIREEKGLR